MSSINNASPRSTANTSRPPPRCTSKSSPKTKLQRDPHNAASTHTIQKYANIHSVTSKLPSLQRVDKSSNALFDNEDQVINLASSHLIGKILNKVMVANRDVEKRNALGQ